ncbi:MAG: diphosphomevalonate decarboxylase [Anaerolineaceae bacterium]|nr:diphosphomevalonate decarboxylase [Anaerolineaceae bacterium]
MTYSTATAIAHPNIAFIKYWGNRDHALRLPLNGSISMNLAGLFTRTQATFDPALERDELTLNHQPASGAPLERVSRFLDHVRALAGVRLFCRVVSENNFPTGAGVASSAAAFAALSLAASQAVGMRLNPAELSRLARLGSGSACRSVPGGFVEWQPGSDDQSSYAVTIAPPDHWNLVDCIAVIQTASKAVGSSEGHRLAGSSPLQNARLADCPRRLDMCRRAILERDFDALAEMVEIDSNLMHAVMMTSTPALFYWEPVSVQLMKLVPLWRKQGLPVCYTLDAGPNVHLLCPADAADQVKDLLSNLEGVKSVLTATVGAEAHLV